MTADRSGWRPRFHVTGERNWINDPNGPIQHGGVFHLFFQANVERPFWGAPAWGHVTSTDLVTWSRRPAALVPDAGGPDADGCWSGCARLVDGRPALYYTGVAGDDDSRVESVCRAWGSDDLLRWEKDPANPLVAGPPAGLGTGYHRDPFLWRDGDGWHMLIGGGTAGPRPHGQVLRYDSPDAARWRYGGVFFAASGQDPGLELGAHWECPQLLRFQGGAAALVVSCGKPGAAWPLVHAVAFIGRIEDGRFEGELAGRLDAGDVLYAPAACEDEAGRHLLWGWAQERLAPDVQATLAHAGALSLPREVVLADGRLLARPVPELEGLRVAPLAPGDAAPQMELRGSFSGRGRAGWALTPGVTALVDLDRHALDVSVDDGAGAPRRLSAALSERDRHALRVFVDGSLLEVFADDGRAAVTTRAYPPSGAWARVLPVLDPAVRVRAITAWRLRADAIDP